jgi:CHAT domain-containing protein
MGNKQSKKDDQEYANENRAVVSGVDIQRNLQDDGRQAVNMNGIFNDDNLGSAKPNIQQDAARQDVNVNARRNLTQVIANKRMILSETTGERKRLMRQRIQLNEKEMKLMSSNLESETNDKREICADNRFGRTDL